MEYLLEAWWMGSIIVREKKGKKSEKKNQKRKKASLFLNSPIFVFKKRENFN